MCTTAAPARAASIAASAICSGVTGTCSLRPTVSPAPVTAQVTKTSQFTASSVRYANLRCTSCEARTIMPSRFPMVQSAPTQPARPRRAPRHRAGVRAGRDAAGRARVRRERGVPARAAATRGRARAHLLRPARRSTAAAASRASRDRCEVIEELTWGDSPDLLGDRAGRLLRRAAARARLRGAEASAGCRRSAAPTRPRARSRSPSRSTAPTRPRSRRPRVRVDGGYVLERAQEVHRQRADRRPLHRLRHRRAGQPLARHHRVRGRAAATRASSAGRACRRWAAAASPPPSSHFEDCFVPDDRRLGDEGEGFRGLM